jgi:hypothetical protein
MLALNPFNLMRATIVRALGWASAAFLAAAPVALAQDSGFARQAFFDGKISIELPVALKPMPADMVRTKYPNAKPPFAAYSDANGEVSVVLSHTVHPLAADNVGRQTQALRAQFEKLSQILRWHGTTVTQLGGRTVGILDFDSRAVDTQIRNKMMIAELGGRMLIVTFNLTKRHEAEWALIADRVLHSLRSDP